MNRMRIVLLLQEQWKIGWIGNEYEGCHFYPTTRYYDQQLTGSYLEFFQYLLSVCKQLCLAGYTVAQIQLLADFMNRNTVKPLLRGHPRDLSKCPLNWECLLNRGLL